jgi:hypothetical protein
MSDAPDKMYVNDSGAFSLIKYGNYKIEYIPKDIADKREHDAFHEGVAEASISNNNIKQDATKNIRAMWEKECEGKPLDREKYMKLWDYYRNLIAEGDKGSLPRDWFENILDYITMLETAIEADLVTL